MPRGSERRCGCSSYKTAEPTASDRESERQETRIRADEELTDVLFKLIPEKHKQKLRSFLYGSGEMPKPLDIKGATDVTDTNLQVAAYGFWNRPEVVKLPLPDHVVRVALFQHRLPLPSKAPVWAQYKALYELASRAVEIAKNGDCDIFCFPEVWNMPYCFYARPQRAYLEYAESVENGQTIMFIRELAQTQNIVIISPIMERDDISGLIYNTAVIIDNNGSIMGKHRKLHIPKKEGCYEANVFVESDLGHAVYQTEYAKIAINICDGRHHDLNWMMAGLNGAEIVFNPCACSSDGTDATEAMWPIEARNAAFQHSYYVCAVNRVGTEVFQNHDSNGKNMTYVTKSFFGSSYVAAPDGTRCPSLSNKKQSLLIAEMDLQLCGKAKNLWRFKDSRKLPQNAAELILASMPNYVPLIVPRPRPIENSADDPAKKRRRKRKDN